MIPMCWKCCNKITEPDATGRFFKLVGCIECEAVYDSAMIHCPIFKVTKSDVSNLPIQSKEIK